jgi:lysophospholipase L1-like esterase
LVERCEWAKLLENSDVLNRGILGDDTLGVLHRIEATLKPVPPRKIYLMIGINDLFLGVSENHVLENYADILKRIKVHAPECEVVVNGLLPIDPRHAPKPIPSQSIRSLNSHLHQLCREKGVVYLETFTAFADKNDRLDDQYSHDGLHLNAKGYQNWKWLLEKSGNK